MREASPAIRDRERRFCFDGPAAWDGPKLVQFASVYVAGRSFATMISMNESGRDRDRVYSGATRFETTRWSMVLAARDGDSTEAFEALGALCSTYWYPLYAFIRRKGHDAEAAQDLVQGFFTRLLEKGDLVGVKPEKGKFRSFLMAACTHYLANQADHDQTKKRGGGRSPISIDRLAAEGRYGREPTHNLTAERL
jgi:hypothetical protein